jgi:hypothetical protein
MSFITAGFMDFEYTREIDVIEHNKSNGRMFEYCS